MWKSMRFTLVATTALSYANISIASIPRSATDAITFTTGKGFGNATIRYREVPSEICELEPGVKSFSGYVDISEDKHMFFWFFEARNVPPTDAPLTTWISGGPGDSSMSELFTEHGPCRIHQDGTSIHYNPFSWNNYSNVLYVDQPVQVGFSYTNLVPGYFDNESEDIIELADGGECPDDADDVCGHFSQPNTTTTANSTIAAAPDFWLTLQAFIATFPEYAANGFHFGSESYGGHYVPIFSKYILDQNDKNIAGASHIDLKSILVGNGWFSPQLQTAAYYDYAFDPGSPYDLEELEDSAAKSRHVHDALYGSEQCLDQLKECDATGEDATCISASEFCYENATRFYTDWTKRDNNDIRELDPSPFPNYFYIDYLRQPNVTEAIGAYQTYIELNPVVGAAFDLTGDDARELNILGILREFLEKDIRITLYAGDADYECNWLGVESVANNIGATGYEDAGYTEIVTPDQVVHGAVKQSGGFSFVRVFEAGHAVGAFQPLLLQTLFARTLDGTDIATGNVQADAEYRSAGPRTSDFHEGNGTVQDHAWSEDSTYNTTSNTPTLEDFQPTWNPAD